MQTALEFYKPIKKRKPDLKFKKQAYATLDINQKINLKSWFFSDCSDYKEPFWNFVNGCMVLVNINNNDYYTSMQNIHQKLNK